MHWAAQWPGLQMKQEFNFAFSIPAKALRFALPARKLTGFSIDKRSDVAWKTIKM